MCTSDGLEELRPDLRRANSAKAKPTEEIVFRFSKNTNKRTSMKNSFHWAAGLLAVVALSFAACTGTGYVEATGAGFGVSGKIKGVYHNCGQAKCAHFDEIRGNARVDVEFRDANGNKIQGTGATGVAAGDSVTVPAGAATMTVSGPSSATSCTGCGSGSGSGTGGGTGGTGGTGTGGQMADAFTPSDLETALVNQGEAWLYVFPLDAQIEAPAPSSGRLSNTYASFDFRFRGQTTHDQLWALVAPIMLADVGSMPAAPRGVKVNSFMRVVTDANGVGARLYVVDSTNLFKSFRFTLNGSTIADLNHNSLSYQAPGGWRVIEVPIRIKDLVINGNSSSNDYRVEADGGDGLEGYEGSLAYW